MCLGLAPTDTLYKKSIFRALNDLNTVNFNHKIQVTYLMGFDNPCYLWCKKDFRFFSRMANID